MKNVINFLSFILNLIKEIILKVFSILNYLVKVIFTVDNLKKVIKVVSSKIFWLFVLLHTLVRFVMTGDQYQSYSPVANFLFPKIHNVDNTFNFLFVGSGLLIVWLYLSTKDKIPKIF